MDTSLGEIGLNSEEGFNLKHGTFITSLDVKGNNSRNQSPSKPPPQHNSNNNNSNGSTKSSTKVIEQLYSQIDQLTNNNFHLTNQNQDLLKQINLLNDQIAKSNRINDMSRNEINSKDLKIKKLEKQINGYIFQLEKFEKDYEFLRTEFLEKANSYHQDNMTLEEEVQQLKTSLKELLHNDPLNKSVKEYDHRFNQMDSSFKDLKFRLIEQMDDLKLENSINIDKLTDLYSNANDLLSELDNNNETKRQYLRERLPKMDREIRKVNDKQQYLNDTLSQLEQGASSSSSSNIINTRHQRQNNRHKRASLYDNSANIFNNNNINGSKSNNTSPYLNNRRNSRFYGSQLDKPSYESQSKSNSPNLNSNNLSNKRKSFLLDEKKQTTLGLGIQNRRTSSMFVDQTSSNNSTPSLPGLKRGGSIKR
ncbi:hypothetical protein ACO0SA_003754 [Hanseniaspora valbyensis]